jgi:hypothetical protein
MTERVLHGHLGTQVTIDLCLPCQAFWFDGRESLQLSPGSTLQLFETIGEQATAARQPLSEASRCPRCSVPLKLVSDLQRNTRFQYRQCPNRHGRFITFYDFLREKHFVRPLSRAQVEELRQHVQMVNCSNCGASVDLATGSACRHCGSALSMLDMRQAEALVTQLQQATQPREQVDPALPMRLARARRETEAAFSAFEHEKTWFDDARSVGLVGAGLSAISRWMRGVRS